MNEGKVTVEEWADEMELAKAASRSELSEFVEWVPASVHVSEVESRETWDQLFADYINEAPEE